MFLFTCLLEAHTDTGDSCCKPTAGKLVERQTAFVTAVSAAECEDTPETVLLYKISKQSSPGSVAFVLVFIHSAVIVLVGCVRC